MSERPGGNESSKNGGAASWLLKPLRCEGLPESVAVGDEGLTLGRDPTNSLVVPAAHPEVSAHHLRLELEKGRLWIEDLGSTNGTWVGPQRIQRRELRAGEVFQLGSKGPRFIAVRSVGSLNSTTNIPAHEAAHQRRKRMGTETILVLKEQLGISGPTGLGDTLQRRTRRATILTGALFLLALTLGLWGFGVLRDHDASGVEEMKDLERDLRVRLAAAQEQFEQHRLDWEQRQGTVDADRLAWERARQELEDEKASIERILARISEDGASTSAELQSLHARLDQTTQSLTMYDPISLEHEKLKKVSEVERAVVFIEIVETFSESESGRRLYFDYDEHGQAAPNFEQRGTLFAKDGSGSGFCVDAGGWIMTNAHVVHRKDQGAFDLGGNIRLLSELEISVVFSGESVRHRAELVSWANAGDQDLALLRIRPFEGMPALQGFRTDTPPPPTGGEVFLMGFPLGKSVMQEGDRVLASTFRGILSRVVGNYLQVDAAVHPGNSGGPVIDAQGEVLGVVVGMQTGQSESDPGSSAIGYILPVGTAAALWPPAEGSVSTGSPASVDPGPPGENTAGLTEARHRGSE